MSIDSSDIRVSAPILTFRRAAELIGITRPEKLRAWSRASGSRPALVHAIPPRRKGWPTLPLIGLAESSSLNALRDFGMSMQQASAAAQYIRSEMSDQYALANPQFVTDGTDAFIETDDVLMRIKDQQGAFKDVLRDHLRPLILGADGYVEQFLVEADPRIIIDPRFNSGRPSFADSMMPVFPIVDLLLGGENPRHIADDFEVDFSQVEFIDEHKERFSLIA